MLKIDEIIVINSNKPTKEESEERVKALGEFLVLAWEDGVGVST